MWLQLQSKYPELLWREKGTDGRLICSIKIRRLCWAICNLRTRNGKFKRLFTFFLSFFTHDDDSCSYRRKAFYAYVHSFRLLNNYHSYQSVVCRFNQEKKNCEWLWQHSLKSTHILKQRNKQKIEPVNINLSLINCRKFTCLVRFIFSYSSEKKIRNDIENIEKCTLLWFIYSITQNALHVWFVRKIREKMYFCFISQLLAFKWVI